MQATALVEKPRSMALPATSVNAQDQRFFKALGARIAEHRPARGLTQQTLADTLGVAQQTLAHYEVGHLRVPASLLPGLSHQLAAPANELLGTQ